jgi:TetR/AcrR family transcriptional regulator
MGETEKKILNAAREEFIATGLKGARMQTIADRAGVNKALLHYYFRSKEKLYEEALSEVVETLWGEIGQQIQQMKKAPDIKTMISVIVTTYFKTMQANPLLIKIIIRELADDGTIFPIIAKRLFDTFGKIPKGLLEKIQEGIKDGDIHSNLKPVDILINTMGMCAITFAIAPVAKKVSECIGFRFEADDAFFNSRINSIITMVCDGIFTRGNRE